MGPTLSEVSTALNTYRNAGDMPVWAVAENYRSEAVFREAAELASQLGRVIKVSCCGCCPRASSASSLALSHNLMMLCERCWCMLIPALESMTNYILLPAD